MAQTFTTQSIASLFGFPFKDARWRSKLLTGGVISLISPFLLFLPSFLVAGYGFRMMRRIINDREEPSLPEWTDWSGLFVDGIRFSAVWQIYFFPVLILLVICFLFMLLPGVLVGLLQDASDEVISLLMLPAVIGPLLMMVVVLLSMVLNFFVAAASAHMVARDSFAAGFRISEWWPIMRANLVGFMISWLLVMAFSYLVALAYQLLTATVILCCLAPVIAFLVSFYQSLMIYALFAIAYREGLDRRQSLQPQIAR
jgi:hypothetical protein